MRLLPRLVLRLPSPAILTASCIGAFLLLPTTAPAAAPAPQGPAAPEPVRFGRDVRPILADRCFRCHGPDAATREAGLRLDVREAALASREDGAAIVPFDPAGSRLWQRVTAHDEDERMPPTSSGKRPLSAAEQATVERWILEGASYEAHWAFVPPTPPPVPVSPLPGARNAVDHFVFAALAGKGLQPSPEADAATLARRVFLVLTGLPPTPEELDGFLGDPSADAYERLVDRLLSTEPYRTRHAEHLAQPWLDAARYADTSGIHMDAGRQIWPWRDWLIEALRDDMPFDRFVVEQMAGDLLPGATTQQRIASGFLRNHVTTDEGGAIDEEYRVEYAAERTATVGSVFLGLTLGCARCHDHKYDPIRQEDYFRLFAFFNSNQEPGLYSQSPDPNRALEPFLEVPSPEQQAERDRLQRELAAAQQALHDADPEEAAQRQVFFADLRREAGSAWPPLRLEQAASRHGSTLLPLPDGSVLASGENPAKDVHQFTLRTDGEGLRLLCLEALPDPSLPEGKVGRAPNGNAVLDVVRLEVRSAGSGAPWTEVPLVWAIADVEQGDGDHAVVHALRDDDRGWAVGAHQGGPAPRRALFLAERPFGAAGGTELRVTLEYDSVYAQHAFGRVRLHAGALAPGMLARLPLAVSGFYVAGPFAADDGPSLYAQDHGPETAATIDTKHRWGKVGWRFDRALREASVGRLPQGRNATYVGQSVYSPSAREAAVSLGSDDGFQLFVDGTKVAERAVDRAAAPDQDAAKFAQREGPSLHVLKVVNTGGEGAFFLRRVPAERELPLELCLALLPEVAHDDPLRARLADAWRVAYSPGHKERLAAVERSKAALAALDRNTPRTMVMQEAAEPRPTFVLVRGEYDKPDPSRPVQRELPAMFGSLPADAPRNRLGLAQWLVSPQNPLLLRVASNRLWEFVFGSGLVRTSEDFGLQGDWPSHLELLDWLACELRARGHSRRELLRLLVTSATFRQQAVVNGPARAVDADNRLHGWFSRRRLPAEAIRDQALFVAGLLVERKGGPSVKPYQPPGLWQEVAMIQSNTRAFERGAGDDLWRRSLYTYWKRACPPPSLLLLDAPTREFCTIRRSTTNTPLQALVLWNDEQFFEAARVLAQRTLREPGDDRQRLQTMHRRCTGQPMDEARATLALATLDSLRRRYAAAPADAAALLAVGEAPRMPDAPAVELAPFVVLANAFLNLDATLCID